MKLHTIPTEKPFLTVLATWILAQYGHDIGLFTRTLVLLPTRRACRSLRDAFLECTRGKPTLLPRILPVNDLDEQELMLPGMAERASGLLPAMSPLRRQLLLCRLVMKFEGNKANVEQATQLAQELANFMDEVAFEGVNLSALDLLAPEELALHWQQTLAFLRIVSHQWPSILKDEQALDIVDRRNHLLRATADAWQENPPGTPVIAAGLTGGNPVIVALLSAIAKLPDGRIILPGLDREMPEKEWDMVSQTHPQAGMKELLHLLNCRREQVVDLVQEQVRSRIGSSRIMLLKRILQPAEATANWLQTVPSLEDGLRGIRLITAETQLDEAGMIAICLREALETPGKTAALVTPDRMLARMVAAQMRRFGININDSAGQPLIDTPSAGFMMLSLELIATRATPVALLAALRHPLAAAGMAKPALRQLSRVMELKLLRGIRHRPGLQALTEDAQALKERNQPLEQLLIELAMQANEFSICFERDSISLRQMLDQHIAFAEWLASTDETPGAEALWPSDAGNQLARFFAELREQAGLLGEINAQHYPGLLRVLLSQQQWRPTYGQHPRLHILGPLEARLQHFDLMILGSLNEDTWPAAAQADPWMSRPMRQAFGLPAPERMIGQSAHDFYQLCAAPEVVLSRAQKVEGAPTVASRWLVRLETLLNGHAPALLQQLHEDKRYKLCLSVLNAPQPLPAITTPVPAPPVAARPRRLSATAIDNWLRDPYIIYAAHILKLQSLEALDQEPDAADFGSVAHKAMELFVKLWPGQLPDDARQQLLACGRTAFAAFLDRPAVAALWWPRFEAMSGWLIEQEQKRRMPGCTMSSELKGEWQLMVDGKPFVLTTRIDRLETYADGRQVIIDYKTGMVPEKKDMENGLANQMPVEALIALHGELLPVPPAGLIEQLEYWKLAGNAEGCHIAPFSLPKGQGMDEFLQQTRARLEALIRAYDDPAMPYAAQTDPSLAPRYNNYAHLIRHAEWESV